MVLFKRNKKGSKCNKFMITIKATYVYYLNHEMIIRFYSVRKSYIRQLKKNFDIEMLYLYFHFE